MADTSNPVDAGDGMDIVERLRWLAVDYRQNVPNLNDSEVMAMAADEIERLRDGIRSAVVELDADHRPEGNPGKEPWGCVMCYPRDGSWPCVSKMIADDLRNL